MQEQWEAPTSANNDARAIVNLNHSPPHRMILGLVSDLSPKPARAAKSLVTAYFKPIIL
jgi:hypothetical protein